MRAEDGSRWRRRPSSSARPFPSSRSRYPADPHDLVFDRLAATWDEAFPWGTACWGPSSGSEPAGFGCLWTGPTSGTSGRCPTWIRPSGPSAWVEEPWRADDYGAVQRKFDAPYEESPAPTKIPAGALEFATDGSARRRRPPPVEDAVCSASAGPGGKSLEASSRLEARAAAFALRGAPADLKPSCLPPLRRRAGGRGDSVAARICRGSAMSRASHGVPRLIVYRQQGWGGFYYRDRRCLAGRRPGPPRRRLEHQLEILR